MSLATDGIETLHVPMGERSYDIFIGDGAISHAGSLIKDILKAPRAIIVTDENIAPSWLEPLKTSLNDAGIKTCEIILPPGEHTKSVSHLEQLLDNLLENNIDRKTTLIALGGGVIGDLTGFAAAVVMRGVDFVQVPTTLLSQVDSSVGGKTGIDTRFGKNLIGAFHQPRVVITDTSTLDTLPMRERLCGYAEVIKYGVINDRGFYDEREQGLRALLNLGHTFGHALEAQIGFEDKLKHGEAVAIGMMMALELSVRLAMASEIDRDRLRDHLKTVGLPVDLKGLAGGNWTADALLDHMGRDKKTQDGKLTFILARAIGNSFVANDVDHDAVKGVLEGFIADAR